MSAIIKGRPVGHPTKLTPFTHKLICDAVAKGNYPATAARIAGIDHTTLRTWLDRGELETEGIYHAFLADVKTAEAESEAARVAEVVKAGAKNWVAAMTFLERRHPDRWGRRERTQVDINETKVIQIQRITIEQAPVPALIEGESREIEAGNAT